MCDAFEAEYEAASTARSEELELIETVRGMVKNRLGALDSTSVGRRDDDFTNESVRSYGTQDYTGVGGDTDDRRAEWESQ
jgi:hypothetical protein